ncbi:hypothetical protein Tco_0409534 [Tanacetum coccineum]
MIVYSLLTGVEIDIQEIIFNDLVTRLTNKPRKKYVAYPRFLSCVLEHLLGFEYTQDKALGSIPLVLSKLNYHLNTSKVPPIELTEFMPSVVNHQASVSPTPSLEKSGQEKERKSHQRPQSVSSDQIIDPQDAKGNKKTPLSWDCIPHNPKMVLANPKFYLKEKTTDPKDLEGNKQPADKGFQSTSDEGILKSQPLPEGYPTDSKDLERNTQLAGMGLPFTHLDEDTRTYSLYSRLLMEESDDEVKELSHDDIFEAGEYMDDPFSVPSDEETQPPPSTEQPSTAKKHIKSEDSPEPYDSQSLSASLASKPYENYMPATERVLAKTLQSFLEVLYAQVAKDNLAKHEDKVLDVAEAYTKNSSNLTELLTLVNDLDLPSIKYTIESLHEAVTLNDHLGKPLKDKHSMLLQEVCLDQHLPLLEFMEMLRRENSAHTVSISPFVPSPEPSLEKKAEEKIETPSHIEGEQEDKDTNKDPQITQPEPIQTII